MITVIPMHSAEGLDRGGGWPGCAADGKGRVERVLCSVVAVLGGSWMDAPGLAGSNAVGLSGLSSTGGQAMHAV